ncbi:lysozyme [Methylobacterium iners]|uniref:Lysozyme n=1 Tax=Methylobacterium iners TaxID=418707 RepID=A0ABQ4RQA4_9HYPH|nr:lysozyme [Methylobacterium iners]GJD92945.1 Lysozyme RrrD [Methylobacterium iners]
MSRLTSKKMWGGALTATAAGVLATMTVTKDEGVRLKAYRDIVNVPTICIGETKGVKMGDVYTREQCEAMLLRRLDEFAGKVEHCIKKPMSDKVLVAFTGLAYNIGSGGFCKSTTVRLYNEGRYAEACHAMTRFNRAGGRVIPGLVSRRKREEAMCLEGIKA